MKGAERLDTIINMLIEFSNGNFDAREEVTDSDDPFNAVVSGLNMLGEELSNYEQEQLKFTASLNERNELISRIISSSDEFFYVVDIDPADSFINNFTYASWQIEHIQGSHPDELKKHPYGWYRSIHPDDIECIMETNRKMFSTRQPVTRVYRVKHSKTGEYVWLEDHVTPVPDEDGFVRVLYGSVRDITERKKSELERERLIKELSNKYNELMQFNYIVSHNLRSPVAHILGLIEIFNTAKSDEDRAETQKYMLEAATALDNILKELNTILSTRSDMNEKREPFLISEVTDTILSSLKREIDHADATINVRIPEGADEIVSIKSFIQSAIYNLVSNAIKYRSTDRLPLVDITVEKQGDRTVISVSDNGTGINLEKYGDKIFGLHNRFHMGYEGKGLGLHMTRSQIESLGGTITVESEEGTGSTFTITL